MGWQKLRFVGASLCAAALVAGCGPKARAASQGQIEGQLEGGAGHSSTTMALKAGMKRLDWTVLPPASGTSTLEVLRKGADGSLRHVSFAYQTGGGVQEAPLEVPADGTYAIKTDCSGRWRLLVRSLEP